MGLKLGIKFVLASLFLIGVENDKGSRKEISEREKKWESEVSGVKEGIKERVGVDGDWVFVAFGRDCD